MDKIIFKPIGIIHSEFSKPNGTPIQPTAAKGIRGSVEIFPEFVDGLKDLEGFSHIYLIFNLHLSKNPKLKVIPFLDNNVHGVFSTRAPSRPNPIGLSIVELISIEKNILHISDVDIVDGTPLLDIKPYVPDFDRRETEKIGWLNTNVHKLPISKDDGRFIK